MLLINDIRISKTTIFVIIFYVNKINSLFYYIFA